MTLHDLGFLGQAHAAHGTRANYRSGCRCTPCRAANAAYELQRAAREDQPAYVDPAPARAKLERLAAVGIGHRQAANAAGVSFRTVQRIRKGKARRIRAIVAQRILALERVSLARGVYVNGYETRHYIESLLREDYHPGWLARKLGIACGRLRIGQSGYAKRGKYVRASTSFEVRQLSIALTAE